MGLNNFVIELSTSDEVVKGSGRWKDGKTVVTLTPKDPPTTGSWTTGPDRGSDIDSGGGSEHATYEWKKSNKTLSLNVGGYSGNTSIETPVVLAGFNDIKVGDAGSGTFKFRNEARKISWVIQK